MSSIESIQRLKFIEAANPKAIGTAIAKIKEYEAVEEIRRFR